MYSEKIIFDCRLSLKAKYETVYTVFKFMNREQLNVYKYAYIRCRYYIFTSTYYQMHYNNIISLSVSITLACKRSDRIIYVYIHSALASRTLRVVSPEDRPSHLLLAAATVHSLCRSRAWQREIYYIKHMFMNI